MDNITRRDAGLPYISDDAVFDQQKVTRRLLREFNTTDPSDFETLGRLAGKIVSGAQENVSIMPPFYCDYGFHIQVGKAFLPIITAPYWM